MRQCRLDALARPKSAAPAPSEPRARWRQRPASADGLQLPEDVQSRVSRILGAASPVAGGKALPPPTSPDPHNGALVLPPRRRLQAPAGQPSARVEVSVAESRPVNLHRTRMAARRAAELADAGLLAGQPLGRRLDAQRRTQRARSRLAAVCGRAKAVSATALRNLARAHVPTSPRLGPLSRRLHRFGPGLASASVGPLEERLKDGWTVLPIGDATLSPEEVVALLRLFGERTESRGVDLGDFVVTPAVLTELDRLILCGTLTEVTGGLERDALGVLRPLRLPPAVVAMLRRNGAAVRAADDSELELASVTRRIHEARAAASLLSSLVATEGVLRAECRDLAESERKAVAASALHKAALLSEAQERHRRAAALSASAAAVAEAEADRRPGVAWAEWEARCSLFGWHELRLRAKLNQTESDGARELRVQSFEDWELHKKLLLLRYHRESVERKEFGVCEQRSRIDVSEEETTERLGLHGAYEQGWTDVRRVLSAREARAEEERRREQQRQHEEERERQWRRDRHKKDQERLETERHRSRERVAKDEKKLRGNVRKVEESVRMLLLEAAVAIRLTALQAEQLGAALAERASELARQPELRLEPDVPGHHVFFIQGTEGWVPVVPQAVSVTLAMPSQWQSRMRDAEERAKKAAKSEQQQRVVCDRQTTSLLQQISGWIDGVELRTPEDYGAYLRSCRGTEELKRLVCFPPVDRVEEEKLRIWGGRVLVHVHPDADDPREEFDGTDLVQLGGTHKLHSETDSGAMRIFLPGNGRLRPSHLCDVLRCLEYSSTSFPSPKPYSRKVRIRVCLNVYNLSDTSTLIDFTAGTPSSAGTAKLLPVTRPVPTHTTELSTSITTFICVHRPYMSLTDASGRLGTDDCEAIPYDLPRSPADENVPALALYPSQQKQETRVSFSGLGSGGPPKLDMRAGAPGRTGVPQMEFHERESLLVPLMPRGLQVEYPPATLFNRAAEQLVVRGGDRRDALMTNFAGGRLAVVFERGYTCDDLVIIQDEQAVDLASRTVTAGGVIIGTVDEAFSLKRQQQFPAGVVVTHSRSRQHDKAGTQESVEGLVLNFGKHEATPGQITTFVGMLRFSNPSRNPTPGKRRMALYLLDSHNRGTGIRWHTDVKWTDRPPELKLEETRLLFRPSSHTEMPVQFLQYFERNKLVLAAQGKLTDVDTDRFCGGYMNVRLLPAQASFKTDGIGIIENPEPQVGIYCQKTAELFPGGQHVHKIHFNGVVIGRACFSKGPDGEGEPSEISVDFVGDGNASIEGAQALLRSFFFYSTELQHVGAGVRQLEIQVLTGPTMMKPDVDGKIIEHATRLSGNPLLASVQIRAATPLIKVPLKHITMRYFEGSGPRRLGPYDLIAEEDQTSKDWAGGFLKAELIECGEEEDVLKLQEGHGIRIVLVSEADADAEHPDISSDWRRRHSSIFEVPNMPEAPPASDSSLDVSSPFISPDMLPTLGSTANVSGFLGRRKSRRRSSSKGADDLFANVQSLSPRSGLVGAARRGSRRESAACALILNSLSPEEAGKPQAQPRRQSVLTKDLGFEGLQESDANLTTKDRVRNVIRNVAVSNIMQRRQVLNRALDSHMERLRERRRGLDTRFRKGRASRHDVFYEDVQGKHLVGTLYSTHRGALLLQFGPRAKRPHVAAVLRCISYSHEGSNPQDLDKKVRVTLADASLTHTQCISEVSIQPVDDVTEFRLMHDRLLYRHGTVGSQAVGAFRVAGLTRGWLEDPDTEYFDGGSLSIELTGGLGKGGDVIGFLSREAQERQYDLEESADVSAMPEPVQEVFRRRPLIDVVDDGEHKGQKRLVYAGTDVGILTAISAKGGKSNFFSVAGDSAGLKIAFPNRRPEHDKEGGVVPLWLASYMLNCLTYTNTAERIKEGTRTYRLQIIDPENSTPGRTQLIIDVSGPTLYVPGFRSSVVYAGRPVVLFPPVQVSLAEKSAVTRGYFEAGIAEADPRDALKVPWGKMSLSIKDQQNLVEVHGTGSAANTKYLCRVVQTAHSIRLEFTWASKITAKQLQSLVRLVSYTREQPKPGDDTPDCVDETRKVIFALSDGTTVEPNVCVATVTIESLTAPPESLGMAVAAAKTTAKAIVKRK